MNLSIDNRESKVLEYLKDKDISYTCSNLDIGDFIFNVNDVPIKVIERKTIKDLISSIIDGRYREQKRRLLSCYDKSKILYIIENFNGFSSNVDKDKEDKMVTTSIINMIMKDDMNVVFTRDVKDTCEFLIETYNKISESPEKYLHPIKDDVIAYDVKPPHKKQNNITKQTCFIAIMMQIPGVSINTAKAIANEYESLNNLYEIINKKEDSVTKESPVELITKIKINKKHVSKKVAENIIHYMS